MDPLFNNLSGQDAAICLTGKGVEFKVLDFVFCLSFIESGFFNHPPKISEDFGGREGGA